MKITAVVNTYNSAQFLRRCLDGLVGFDEIVVCDMYSTDDTVKIASEYGCKIVYFEHTGIVEPARNYAISQSCNEWVIVVDSDEVVSKELREYLYSFIAKNGNKYAGLYIARKNYFMGKFMHGLYPDHILRFMRKSQTDWPSTIHATPHIDGKVTRIPSRHKKLAFEHLANETIEQRIRKMNLYTEKELIRRGGSNSSIFISIIKCVNRFCQKYILKGGFRDGKAGYANAVIDATYKFVTIAKLWEKNEYGRDENYK